MSRKDTRTLESAPEAKTSHSQAETKNALDGILALEAHPFLSHIPARGYAEWGYPGVERDRASPGFR